MSELMTPLEAFAAAKVLHGKAKLNVNIYLDHPHPHHRRMYAGYEDRKAGRTARVTVDVDHDAGIDDVVALRDKIREHGYDVEKSSGTMTVIGRWSS